MLVCQQTSSQRADLKLDYGLGRFTAVNIGVKLENLGVNLYESDLTG